MTNASLNKRNSMDPSEKFDIDEKEVNELAFQ